MVRWRVLLAALTALALLADGSRAGYTVINLVSDGAVPALQPPDPQLKNPWGMSFAPGGPFWVSDNGSGVSTLYNGSGVKQGLVVSMPNNDPNSPVPITGQVFSGTSSFNGDLFLFAGEDGGIYGWRGALGRTAETLKAPTDLDPTDPNAGDVYKGLALSGSHLIAANFRTGKLDVFNGSVDAAHETSVADPNVPAGYAPFGVQNLKGTIYVTFALQDPFKHDDVAGAGNGFVDIFDPLSGTFTRQTPLISGNPLNSPWGLALAPSNFGPFSNDLLVGNFGDGTINAFDPATGAPRGTLTSADGSPIAIDGLWGLMFGNGGTAGPTNRLFFTAGTNGEADGLFGAIDPVPEPASAVLFALGGVGLALFRRRTRAAR